MMRNPNLMKRLAKGKTPNPNEALHIVIWSRCAKTVFVCRQRLEVAVAEVVAEFNAVAYQLTEVMTKLSIEVNAITMSYMEENNRLRIQQAEKSEINDGRSQRRKKKILQLE